MIKMSPLMAPAGWVNPFPGRAAARRTETEPRPLTKLRSRNEKEGRLARICRAGCQRGEMEQRDRECSRCLQSSPLGSRLTTDLCRYGAKFYKARKASRGVESFPEVGLGRVCIATSQSGKTSQYLQPVCWTLPWTLMG